MHASIARPLPRTRRLLCLAACLGLASVAPGGRPNLKLEGLSVREDAATGVMTVTVPRPENIQLREWLGGRWGDLSGDDAAQMPAIYADRGVRDEMVGITLSGSGSQAGYEKRAWAILEAHTSDRSILQLPRRAFERRIEALPGLTDADRARLMQMHNPAGFNSWGLAVRRRGWDALDPLMEEIAALDPPVRIVWFWSMCGIDHRIVLPPGATSPAMGWPSYRYLSPELRAGWPAWRDKWKRRGFRFGVWASTPSYPNTGSLARPVRKWLRWKNPDGSTYVMDSSDPDAAPDIDWMIREFRPLVEDMGFEFIGLDALNHLLTRRDEPRPGAFRFTNESGTRESGITLALQKRLIEAYPQVQFVTEGHFPPSEHHALMPTMFVMQGGRHTGKQATIADIGPEQHRLLIPGCEVLALCIGTSWTEQEWPDGAWPPPVFTRLRSMGYTPCVNIFALEDRVLAPRRRQHR